MPACLHACLPACLPACVWAHVCVCLRIKLSARCCVLLFYLCLCVCLHGCHFFLRVLLLSACRCVHVVVRMCAWYALGVVEGEKDRAEGLSAALLWVLDFVEAEQFAGDTRPRYWAIRCLLDSLVRRDYSYTSHTLFIDYS